MKMFVSIAAISVLLLFGCTPRNNYEELNREKDKTKIAPAVKAKMVDSMVHKSIKNYYLKDTIGLIDAPVLVLKATPTKREYSSYKDIQLVYKNVSKKVITAIRFKWYGLNAFGEPAEMGSVFDGIGSGFTDDRLRPGKTDNGVWSILSKDLKKVVKAWPTEVVFEDGTKWFNPNN